MNCVKCGCELKHNNIICLKCYSEIKNGGEIGFVYSLDKEQHDSIEWMFATKTFGEISFVENYLIQVDDDIEGNKISALYTGLVKNNAPYGTGLYFFENGVRYFGEYSPKGKLVNGITVIPEAYKEGLHENFILRYGITTLKDDCISHKHYYGKDKDVSQKYPVCHTPTKRCTKFGNSPTTLDHYLAELIESKVKLSEVNIDIMTTRGCELLRSGATEKAIKFLKCAAQHGNHVAIILLGDCYKSGNGVPKDWRVAEAYYRHAAVSGNHEAEYKLGALLDKHNIEESIDWLEKSAKAGYEPATRYLSGMIRL